MEPTPQIRRHGATTLTIAAILSRRNDGPRAKAAGTGLGRHHGAAGRHRCTAAVDGRLLLLFSRDTRAEPRFQVSATSLSSAQVFGIDLEG